MTYKFILLALLHISSVVLAFVLGWKSSCLWNEDKIKDTIKEAMRKYIDMLNTQNPDIKIEFEEASDEEECEHKQKYLQELEEHLKTLKNELKKKSKDQD